ncbi:MAG: shikimate kinase [Actinobacteria bacterium]|nr:shikimate kinase [Actinomycetota bacterium]
MSNAAEHAATRPSAVALVGFMAAGKSVVGGLVAARLDVPFVDSDALIEEREGPIAEIFAARGEQAFRVLERDVVVEVLESALGEPCVVALGGGAVLSGDVRVALRRLPHVAWLTAPAAVLWARTRGASPGDRPLARDEQAFRRLLEERNELYRRVATAEVLNDGSRALDAVADDIVALAEGAALRPAAPFRPAAVLHPAAAPGEDRR